MDWRTAFDEVLGQGGVALSIPPCLWKPLATNTQGVRSNAASPAPHPGRYGSLPIWVTANRLTAGSTCAGPTSIAASSGNPPRIHEQETGLGNGR